MFIFFFFSLKKGLLDIIARSPEYECNKIQNANMGVFSVEEALTEVINIFYYICEVKIIINQLLTNILLLIKN